MGVSLPGANRPGIAGRDFVCIHSTGKGGNVKTICGAILTAIGILSRPDILAMLPEKVSAVVTAAGAVCTVVGVRHAMAKNGQF